jgi:glycosyltransferase involved in cell wall biosynthesis
MKVSIITVVYNNEKYIRDAIESVLSQDYKNIEYIIIDGNSSDGTKDIIRSYSNKISQFVSEDDNGIFDAMNKGIGMATGEVIGLLNSDDIYIDNRVVSRIAQILEPGSVDSAFGDLVYVDPENLDHVVRYYSSANFSSERFNYRLPPHPTFFVKKKIYQAFGAFEPGYQIAGDFELLTRLYYRHKISYKYLPEVLVKMRTGGLSTRSFRSKWILNKEVLRACDENNIKTNMLKIYFRYLFKIWEFLGVEKKRNRKRLI